MLQICTRSEKVPRSKTKALFSVEEYEREMRGVSEAEARAILRDYSITADAAETLVKIAADLVHGGMGNFVELLELCLDVAAGDRIDMGILEGAMHNKMLYQR